MSKTLYGGFLPKHGYRKTIAKDLEVVSDGFVWMVRVYTFWSGQAASNMEPQEDAQVDYTVVGWPDYEGDFECDKEALIDSLQGLDDVVLSAVLEMVRR